MCRCSCFSALVKLAVKDRTAGLCVLVDASSPSVCSECGDKTSALPSSSLYITNFFFGLYVFSMFANGFLRFVPPPERFWALKSGPGENGRTQAGDESPSLGLLVDSRPLEPKIPASLRALLLLMRIVSAGRLKLGE